jgi:hypothetical protein
MAAFRQKSNLALQAHDTEDAKMALFSASVAAIKAISTINAAETETKAEAEDALIRGRLAKLEHAA